MGVQPCLSSFWHQLPLGKRGSARLLFVAVAPYVNNSDRSEAAQVQEARTSQHTTAMGLGSADRHRPDTPRQSGRHQPGSRQGSWQKVIESAVEHRGRDKFKKLQGQLKKVTEARAADRVAHAATMQSLQDEIEASKALWAVERAGLQAQIDGERKWRIFYEGMARTTADGPRDMERELREATWPSRMQIFTYVDAQASMGVKRSKGIMV